MDKVLNEKHSHHSHHGHGCKQRKIDKHKTNVEDSLVIVIDVQDRMYKAIYKAEEAIKNTASLIEGATILDIPVIFTVQNPAKLGPVNDSLISKVSNPTVVEKMDFSILNEEMEKLLEKYDKKNIVIAGAESHICVFQSTRDLIAKGYNVFVVKDAVSSRTDVNRESGIKLMSDMGAVVTNLETVLFDWLKTSTHPKFKEVQALIK